ncbi:hypothetical protein NK6_852 [Bradyrhizobium diazoefficiens]|uniref:Uncharacterized protein n=1 Tax=Bradyrhizobium diazoefficiens TaxID=1355477 RepID=A0A0E4FSH8_9BRAD|nr:hypothetical protein NK6_852 [Bradyrhizobium diazoefficiens]
MSDTQIVSMDPITSCRTQSEFGSSINTLMIPVTSFCTAAFGRNV